MPGRRAMLCVLSLLASGVHAVPPPTDEDFARAAERYKRYQLDVAEARKALDDAERVAGPDHPGVLPAVNALAAVHAGQLLPQNARLAEPLYARALAITEKTRGRDHPEVAKVLDDLAALNFKLQQHERAEGFYIRSLEIREKSYGPNHPETAQSLMDLADLFFSLGGYALSGHSRAVHYEKDRVQNYLDESRRRYAQAEPLYKRALAIREKALGPDHPEVADALDKLARLYEMKEALTREEKPREPMQIGRPKGRGR